MDHGRRVWLLPAALVGLSVLLAGCATGRERAAEPGELQFEASWDGPQHMVVDVENVGGSPLPLGGMSNMRIMGPGGTTMPLHWNGMAPTLMPGGSRTFDLHAMHMDDGTMGMTMVHAMADEHMSMPAGDYLLHMSGITAVATLEG